MHGPDLSASIPPVPLPEKAGSSRHAREEGADRSAVACATRITALNISFISGPSNYRIPRTCGARGDVRDLALTLAHTRCMHPAVVAAAITRGAALDAVNETRPRYPLIFPLFLPASVSRYPPHSRFSSSSLFSSGFSRLSSGRLTFCMPAEMTGKRRSVSLASCAKRIRAGFRARTSPRGESAEGRRGPTNRRMIDSRSELRCREFQ